MTMETYAKKIFDSADMSGTLTSDPISLADMEHLSVHLLWTGGTADGTLYFEASGEVGQPTSFEDVTDVAVSGAGSQLWLDRNAPYTWARIRYVPNSGAGSLTGYAVTKGDK